MGLNCLAQSGESRPVVLVIDDDRMLLRLTRIVLEEAGYDVEMAQTGREGVHIVRHRGGRIDLVIVDQGLPDCRGLEVIERLQTHWPTLRFLLVTGLVTEEVQEGAHRTARTTVLAKPYSIEEFGSTVHTLIESR